MIKNKIIHIWNGPTQRWKALVSRNRKKAYLTAGIAAGGTALIIALLLVFLSAEGDGTVYRETKAVRGKLTVGVTESGSVNIGVSEQTFDLDLSEYTGDSGLLSDRSGMGGEGMAQIFRQVSSGDSRTLKVEEICVTAGEEIREGDPLLKLVDESVENIRQKLSEDASDAEITLRQLTAVKKQTDRQAEADLAANTLYGTAAQAEYNAAVHQLKSAVEDLEEQLSDKKQELSDNTQELSEMKALLTEQQEVLANAEYAKAATDRESSLYWWIVATGTVTDAETLTESLEEDIETAEENVEQLTAELTSLEIQLSLAKKELAAGEAEALALLALRQFNSENAQEIYDVTVGKSDFEEENARKDYEEAKQRLDEFDRMIVDGVIRSSFSGVITQVGIAQGDSLEQNSSLITLNDYGEATITVEVDEEDMDAAVPGNSVNITFNAFPDQVFKGQVSEIGDAQLDSNTNRAVYSVTVAVDEGADLLYEGMSAEVTFITKESEEVIYISNRAVEREGTASFVKVKDEDGNIYKKEIVTGFSDGINVEVKEGLSEGDTVLIESSAD